MKVFVAGGNRQQKRRDYRHKTNTGRTDADSVEEPRPRVETRNASVTTKETRIHNRRFKVCCVLRVVKDAAQRGAKSKLVPRKETASLASSAVRILLKQGSD
jgi:hypothetical protein